MGMGYGANFAEVIEEKNLKKLCPKTFEAFMDSLQTTSTSLDEVAQFEAYDDLDEAVKTAFIDLQIDFNKKTGLELSMGYHDADGEGDRYDDVDGAFWTVEGMYELTPAGKKIGGLVSRKFWVTFG